MQVRHVTLLGFTRTTLSIGILLRQLLQGQGIVVGYAPAEADVKLALALDALDQAPKAWREALAETDVLLIDWPLHDLENLYREIGSRLRPQTLVLDFSRLKTPAYQLAQTHLKVAKFIGVAPLLAASRLDEGAVSNAAATADLFTHSHFCLVAHPTTSQETLDQAIAFGRLLGAEPIFADPLEYDGLMQITELLPILTAAALFHTASQSEGWTDIGRFAGATFASTTNALSHGLEVTWLVEQNKLGILPLLDRLQGQLKEIRQWVIQEDAAALQTYLTQLNQTRSHWLSQRSVANTGEPSLLDEVEDRSFLRQLFSFKRKS
jgi:prephenate dehydrogenase